MVQTNTPWSQEAITTCVAAVVRSRQAERNCSFFGAPVGLIFSIDRRLKQHSWIDLGLFAQSVMIAGVQDFAHVRVL